MLTTQSRGLQAFRRVEAWFTDHPQVVPATGTSAPALTKQLTALTVLVDRMTQQSTEQITQRGQATLVAKDEGTLRKNLHTVHMKAIVNVANALRGQIPGVGVMKMPSAKIRSEALVKAAEALATMAGVYKDVFIEHGLPQDFLDQLTAATSQLKASIDARGVALSKRVGATTSLEQDSTLGRRIVSMIDASLTHALKNDAATLASWRQAKRITVKPTVTRAPSPVAPAASIAAPVAPTAVPDAHGSVTAAATAEPKAA